MASSAPSDAPPTRDQTTQITILPAMEKIDPFLRFLTKATGKTSVPLKLLQQVLPKTNAATTADSDANNAEQDQENNNDTEKRNDGSHMNEMNEILLELTHRGVLNYEPNKQCVGFPLPPSPSNSKCAGSVLPKPPSKLMGKGLHGSSEPAGKRRLKVLKWTLDKVPSWICRNESAADESGSTVSSTTNKGKKSNNAANSSSKPKAKRNPKKSTTKSKDDNEGTGAESAAKCNRKRTRGKETESSTMDQDEQKQPSQHEHDNHDNADVDERLDECNDRRAAYQALDVLLRGSQKSVNEDKNATIDNIDADSTEKQSTKQWLPCQAAYAGSHPGRQARYGTLTQETVAKIPSEVLHLFNFDLENDTREPIGTIPKAPKRQLFLHQAQAIESAMNNVHTVVQTATGSGKSFCFLVPVFAKAMHSLQQQHSQHHEHNQGSNNTAGSAVAAILLFPTKALAQDQYSKINALLESHSLNKTPGLPSLRAGVIDGDTPHAQRDEIATECQIILTNPDTLHAALLPNWKKRPAYKKLLARVATVVVDEAHVYEGAFGAHVAMVLARLKRVCRVASSPSNADSASSAAASMAINPLFIACSATMLHPEQHFRLLCPIGKDEKVCVLTSKDDGSPCAPKHFFVFNPPILDVNGNSTESVFAPKPKKETEGTNEDDEVCSNASIDYDEPVVNIPISRRKRRRNWGFKDDKTTDDAPSKYHSNLFTRRRHAADETAFLLAKAIAAGVRTISFCKTRSLVEWVYERTLAILQSNPETEHLTSKVESYRGGYTAEARRSIEERLFQRKLWGVVGTNALELGVDVGGVDLTLHTGYPGSISSLLQQSGRAGRGKGSDKPSCSIMVCFSSPSEQYIWKHPTSLLSRGVDAPPTLPINGTVMQGHLLCAGEEFPLTGDRPVSCLLNEFELNDSCPADCELLGPHNVYEDNIKYLLQKGLLSTKSVSVVSAKTNGVDSVSVHSTHPVVKHPWQRVSLRSIEPLSYSIVDLSHNLQGGKTDKIHNKAAVMDTIPYSRVFYHAFPGSIIMHRGRKYRIESMESPPPFVGGASFGPCGCSNLIAFAKPTSLQYSTQALSINQITVVKQMGHAELSAESKGDALQSQGNNKVKQKEGKEEQQSNNESVPTVAVAGHGVVTVKRTVHGYKKLSHVNRKELSRTTITLPPMEYDTYAFWIDADATYLRDVVFNFDGGVHALSHAMVAVAPLFVPCTSSDIDCDHARYDTTRILLYDQRAGGSGVSAQMYNFIQDALQAAVDLLEECTSCYSVKGYDGGCPACLQSVSCDNFHQDLSRMAGIRVGKHLIERLLISNLNSQKKEESQLEEAMPTKRNPVQGKLRSADDMQNSIKPKNIVIGRASWMDNKDRTRFADVDE